MHTSLAYSKSYTYFVLNDDDLLLMWWMHEEIPMYVTLANLKSYADFVGNTDDALLTDLIKRAAQIVETYTGREFAVSGATNRFFDAKEDVHGRTLYLDLDCNAVLKVTNGDGEELKSDEYVTEPRNDPPFYGITILNSSGKSWTYTNDHQNAILVSGAWGYSSTPPADIQHTVIRLASWLYKQRETDTDLDRPFLTTAGITIMPARLPNDVISILNQYKKTWVK